MGDSGDLAKYLAGHDGVITRARALELGLSAHDISGRLRRGEWRALVRGIYRSATHEFGERALVRGAVLAHDGVADRGTAAWWHGLRDTLPAPVALSTGKKIAESRWTLCEVDVVRRRYLPKDVSEERGLSVTGKPLTVLMAAATDSDGAKFLDRVLQRRLVTLPELEQVLERNAGKVGMGRARQLLRVAADGAESDAERLFIQMLRDEGITGWVQQFRFGSWRIDVAWPAERLAVEIDGWAFHSAVEAFRRDRQKGNALEAAGWRRLSFTWYDLAENPVGVVEQVVRALHAARDGVA